MSTIQQPCPSCQRLLELPDYAAGRLSQCPACRATFIADHPANSNDLAGSNVLTRSNEPDRSRVNKFDAAAGHPITVVQCSIDAIVGTTLSIFASRWLPLVTAFLIIVALAAVLILLPMLVLTQLAQSGKSVLAALGFLCFTPVAILVVSCLSVGMARNAIAVARNHPHPLRALLPPIEVVMRFIVSGVAITLGFAVVLGIYMLSIIAFVLLGGDQQTATALSFIGSLFVFAVAVLVYWLLWSWMFVVSDGMVSAFQSIVIACKITTGNKLTSLLIVLIATVLSTLGTLPGGLGLIITQPLTNLLFAVAYLMLTGQAVGELRLNETANQ